MAKDLFTFYGESKIHQNAPLAERLRPRNLDEFVGQQGIISEGRLLRRAIAADRVGNLLLHGPPGVGKTTLARIIAANTRSHFSVLNAVLAGIQDLRNEVDAAKQRLERYGLRSILFVDEVHRFNSNQQDALLPWVENGTLTFIGATTENPYFEVNKALVSRSRLFRLQQLESVDLFKLLERALTDSDRGYGSKDVQITAEAASHLVDVANGDARSLLNALELAVESTKPNEDGTIQIDLLIAEESIQERAVLYDKHGDAHFDTISAFIKSMRGSDPDASLFWLARMIEAGENPRFIFRRMLIAAAEDVGLADPQAIVIVEACAAAFERIGLPEGLYLLAQAALYLSTTDKSNSTLGFFEALRNIRESQREDVPSHLRDANRDKESFGDGVGYRYPHAFSENWVAQQYLPNGLQGEVFWKPTDNGWEGKRRLVTIERRAAQLAAVVESDQTNFLFLSSGPEKKDLEIWLQRQLSQEGERLQFLLKKLWNGVKLSRHHRVLITGSSSLLWSLEPLKKVPEGGVTIMTSPSEKSRLSAEIELLDFLERPLLIDESSKALNELSSDLAFECVGGRIYWKDLTGNKINDIWQAITSKCAENTSLRLLSSTSSIGPAESLKELLQDKGLIIDQFLDEIIEKERDWMSSQSLENILLDSLRELGWHVEIESWQEDLALEINEDLESRWLSREAKYRSLLTQYFSPDYINKFRELLKKLKSNTLKQTMEHRIFSGRL